MAAPPVPRPGRALAVIALAVVALYAWMLISGTTKPKLGLDLQGGTSVTLQPVVPPGETGTITNDAIQQAVGIIRNRVNGLGVAEAEVTTQGSGSSSTIVISVPGVNQGRIVDLVGQTAKLTFRPVLVEGAPAPAAAASASPSPSSSATPSTTASPGASIAASPSASASGNGRTTTGLPKAASTSPSASASPSASPAASPSALGAEATKATVTPAAQKEYDALDCTKPFGATNRPADVADQLMVTCSRDQTAKFILGPVAVQGSSINTAAAALNTQGGLGDWVVNLKFDGTGTKQFADTTQVLVNNTAPTNAFAIVLDGVVVSAPAVQSAILDGNAQISGSFTQQEATDLANVLKYGALPLAFNAGEVQTISPTLGSDQLRAGILAGLLGLLLVALYSLLYYRGLGIVTVLSLTVAALLTYGSLVLLGHTIGYTLTLAGIAGAIVAIGITADSFVVFFERIRDEMRDGRSMKVAVETGWRRARRTILAADTVSFIAAVVLYVLSIGGVRGFAFTLGLTTIIDVVVVFLFTKPLLTILARTEFFGGGHRFSGVDPERLGVHARPAPRRTRPAAKEA